MFIKEGSHFRHVEENSPEHLESKERKSRSKTQAYGESALALLKFRLGSLSDSKEDSIKRNEILEDGLEYSRERLLRIMEADARGDESFEKRKTAVKHFFEEAIQDSALQEQISSSLNIDVTELSPELVSQGLRDKKIEIETFYSMLSLHIDLFHQKVEEIEPVIEKYKAEFRETAQQAVAEGSLPLQEEKLLARLQEQQHQIFDTIDNPDLGQHEEGVISINVDTPQSSIRHIVYHESVHAIAGKSIATYKEQNINMTHEQKSGLLLRLDFPTQKMVTARFAWLNEAETEEIALELLGEREDKGEGYVTERMLRTSLIKEGVPEEAIRAAYFEDYDPNASPGNRMPAWHELARHMNRVGKNLGEDGMTMKDFSTMLK